MTFLVHGVYLVKGRRCRKTMQERSFQIARTAFLGDEQRGMKMVGGVGALDKKKETARVRTQEP